MLAFSGRQDEADPPRIETILGRQVPTFYTRMLTERGVLRELYRSSEPIRVGPVPTSDGGESLSRVAVAVRAGQEVLGSIWAVETRPIGDERLETLREAAELAALHMLRVRAGADVERRLRTELLSTALEGGAGARAALHRLGLADQPVVVLAMGLVNGQHDESMGATPCWPTRPSTWPARSPPTSARCVRPPRPPSSATSCMPCCPPRATTPRAPRLPASRQTSATG